MISTDDQPHPLSALVDCPYWIMDGLGNDFVILDMRRGGRLSEEAAQFLGNRAGPFGCDQIIGLKDAGGDVDMIIYNADGSAAGACGNASRCVGWLLMEERGTDTVRFGTPAGILEAARTDNDDITVDMGRPRLHWQDIPLAEQMDDTRFIDIKLGPIDNPVLWGPSAVSMGNPHCVFFVPDADTQALDRFGPMIEHHPLFPEGANVSVVEVVDEATLKVRTWERGVGLTEACGTAGCAALVSAARRRLTGRKAAVYLPGGVMTVEWRESDDRILMTGPIRLHRQGVIGD